MTAVFHVKTIKVGEKVPINKQVWKVSKRQKIKEGWKVILEKNK